MSQQGERPTGQQDDWWGQLYDDSTGDTGPTPAPDSVDDRFASATDTLGTPPPQSPAVPPPREGHGELRGEPPRPALDAQPGGTPADGRAPEPPQGRGELRGQPPRPAPDAQPGPPPPWWPPNTPVVESRPAADPRTPAEAAGSETDPLWRSGLRRQRAPWEAPPADPPGPATFPQDQGQAMSTEVPPPAAEAQARAEATDPGNRPTTWPQPPGGPPTIGPPPTVGTPSVRPDTLLDIPADKPSDEGNQGDLGGQPGQSDQPVLRVPETPTPLDHVGSGPPTYDAEPTALPPADPDDLDDLVADTVLDGASYGTHTLRAVSVRGDSARFRGEPRRDSLLTARFGTGDDALVLVAMATGARATPDAHRAAAEACQWIGRAVGRSHARLAEDIRAARRGDLKSGLHRLTDRSLGRLRASAVERGVEPEEYTASLRCLLLPADPECRTRVFFGVGAGGLFRLRDGEWQDIEPRVADTTGEAVVGFGSLPHGAPHEAPRDAPHETPDGDRLTMDLGITTPPSPYEPAPEPPPRDPFRFRASVARPGDTLLLCSGGLAEPLRGEPRLVEHLTSRWSGGEPPGVAAFLADSTVRVKGYADDRTAAAVWEA
ncbi:protein phosphatase 2C domain-containing protein [Streptomyces sp. NPDC127119]|uniref:protein phosphatase 2C domain-containing protein n=1 Tax=Streptomyces sp. NPDC127119 TaxID=3345370 RepID=UPI00363C435A